MHIVVSVCFARGWKGVATSMGIDTEDTICLTTQWQNNDGSLGIATYTSSWIAPPADVHSQQRFFYMGAGTSTAQRSKRKRNRNFGLDF